MKFDYRIYYEDTDAGGIVYYANYLKFFERARTEFLRHLGISQSELVAQSKLIFVVRRCEVDYASPARMDDLISVSVVVTKINPASIQMAQEITIGSKILSRLKVEIACVEIDSLKPHKIPQNLKNLFDVR